MEEWEKELIESGLSELEMIWITWFISDSNSEEYKLILTKLIDN